MREAIPKKAVSREDQCAEEDLYMRINSLILWKVYSYPFLQAVLRARMLLHKDKPAVGSIPEFCIYAGGHICVEVPSVLDQVRYYVRILAVILGRAVIIQLLGLMHVMRIHHNELDVLAAQKLTKIKPVMPCRLKSHQSLLQMVVFHQLYHSRMKHIKSRHRIGEWDRLSGEFDPPPVKSPEIMLFAADINADDHCCFFYLLNLLVLCRLHCVDTSLFCLLLTFQGQ